MPLTEEEKNNFLARSSYTGLCALYAFALSKEKQTAFNFKKLFTEIFPHSADYCFGFAVATAAAGLLDFNHKDNIMTVTNISFTSERLRNKFNEKYPAITDSEVAKFDKFFS